MQGWEDPLEKGMATHSRILARRSSQTDEPGGLQSVGWCARVPAHTRTHTRTHISDTEPFLPILDSVPGKILVILWKENAHVYESG